MQHQQWESVVFKSATGRAPVTTSPILMPRNQMPAGPGPTATKSGLSAAALENDSETLKHQTVSTELKKAIMQARAAKQMTQKALAMLLNTDAKTVQAYEAGTAIPNNALIAKMERALGAKLPRAPKR